MAPAQKDDTLLTEMLNIFFFTLLVAFWSRQGEEILMDLPGLLG